MENKMDSRSINPIVVSLIRKILDFYQVNSQTVMPRIIKTVEETYEEISCMKHLLWAIMACYEEANSPRYLELYSSIITSVTGYRVKGWIEGAKAFTIECFDDDLAIEYVQMSEEIIDVRGFTKKPHGIPCPERKSKNRIPS